MMMYAWYLLKSRLDERGQGMVEYGLILALISIAALSVMTPIGTQILETFTKVKNGLPAAQ